MNFSEKLIKLRKENLLSQEELGEKLNVTRQTVSKWELGQTTPDMGKLIEMSKLFGVKLDELTDDSVINTSNDLEENHTKRSIIIVILIVVLCIILFFLISNLTSKISIISDFKTKKNEIYDKISQTQNIIQDGIEKQQDLIQKGQEHLNEIKNQANQAHEEIEKKQFNGVLEMYSGTKSGVQVNYLMDRIVTSNNKNDRLVSVIYGDISTTNTNEIQDLKKSFENWTEYEVSFKYDEDGYIYEVNIK